MKKKVFKNKELEKSSLAKVIYYGVFLEAGLLIAAIITAATFLIGGNSRIILVLLEVFFLLIMFYAIVLIIIYLIKLLQDKKIIKKSTIISRRKNIRDLTFGSLIFAIIIAMTFVPNMGYITVGGISITIIHIPVLIGAALLGWKWGLFFGTIFGIGSFIQAFTYITTNAPFTNPLVSILPRMLFGLIAGLVFQLVRMYIKKHNKRNAINYGLIYPAVYGLLTIFHSVIVLFILYFVTKAGWYYRANEFVFAEIGEIIVTVLALNSILEFIIAIVVCSPINLALDNVMLKSNNN